MAKSFKRFLKARWPALFDAWRGMKQRSSAERPAQQIFTKKYQRHITGEMESLSGPGSDLAQTAAIRLRLPQLVRELNVKVLLDVPCGDFHWMKSVKLDVDYIGADIVKELVERNRRAYANDRRRFVYADVTQDALPPADLILCRDCLVHLSNRDVARAIERIVASGATYLLTTTFVARETNDDIATGKWRPINPQRPPFDFPEPLELIDEAHPLEPYGDKHLGLWKVDDIRSVVAR